MSKTAPVTPIAIATTFRDFLVGILDKLVVVGGGEAEAEVFERRTNGRDWFWPPGRSEGSVPEWSPVSVFE